jgi:uncharacterized protein YbjQ (UPF0145 family)
VEEKKDFDEYSARPIEEQALGVGANAIVGYRISSFAERYIDGTITYGIFRYGTAVFYTKNE